MAFCSLVILDPPNPTNSYLHPTGMATKRILVIAGSDSSGGAYAYLHSPITRLKLTTMPQGARSRPESHCCPWMLCYDSYHSTDSSEHARCPGCAYHATRFCSKANQCCMRRCWGRCCQDWYTSRSTQLIVNILIVPKGMLASAETIEVVATAFRKYNIGASVVDPVSD